MATEVRFITSIMVGIMKAMAVGEQLGIPQLARGGVEAVLLKPSRLKARTTEQAVQHPGHEVHAVDEGLHDFEPRQRETEQHGDDRQRPPREHDDPSQLGLVTMTMTTPPMARMGAYEHHAHHHMAHTFWMRVTSLVPRVMSEAAENRLISASEKATTRANRRRRTAGRSWRQCRPTRSRPAAIEHHGAGGRRAA